MCNINIGDSLNPRKAVVQKMHCTLSFTMTSIRPLSNLGMQVNSPKLAWMGWISIKGAEWGELHGEELTCCFIQARNCESQETSNMMDHPFQCGGLRGASSCNLPTIKAAAHLSSLLRKTWFSEMCWSSCWGQYQCHWESLCSILTLFQRFFSHLGPGMGWLLSVTKLLLWLCWLEGDHKGLKPGSLNALPAGQQVKEQSFPRVTLCD